MIFARLILAVASAFLLALASYPALRLERRKRAGVLMGLALAIALSPCWIPLRSAFPRFLAAVAATALLVKVYDLHAAANRGLIPSFAAFLAFLPNIFSVVWRRLGAEPRPSFHQNRIRLLESLWKMAAAAGALVWLFRCDWTDVPFLLEHCAKTTVVFLFIVPLTHWAAALWRLLGGRARDFMDAPLLATTPADFWRRYNRPAQQFFYEDIFMRAGSTRSPGFAVIITFAASALIHEYVFGITIGRVEGYQTIFFLLQGMGAALTMRVKPAGWRIWPAIAATCMFNLMTGVFFFASVNGVLPFYFRGPPKWLSWG